MGPPSRIPRLGEWRFPPELLGLKTWRLLFLYTLDPTPRLSANPACSAFQMQGGLKAGLQWFVWKIIQQSINNTRINSVFCILTTVNLLFPHLYTQSSHISPLHLYLCSRRHCLVSVARAFHLVSMTLPGCGLFPTCQLQRSF